MPQGAGAMVADNNRTGRIPLPRAGMAFRSLLRAP
jgi:hypothetical protein